MDEDRADQPAAADSAAAGEAPAAPTGPLLAPAPSRRRDELVLDLTDGPAGTDGVPTVLHGDRSREEVPEGAPVVGGAEASGGSRRRAVVLGVLATLAVVALILGFAALRSGGTAEPSSTTVGGSGDPRSSVATTGVAGVGGDPAVSGPAEQPTQPTAVLAPPLVQERQGDGSPAEESER